LSRRHCGFFAKYLLTEITWLNGQELILCSRYRTLFAGYSGYTGYTGNKSFKDSKKAELSHARQNKLLFEAAKHALFSYNCR
jgi:hypothetical protein